MKDGSLDEFIVGAVLALIGLAVIIFHKSIQEWRDYWGLRDWPLGYGDMWTGKYTRGGLVFTYALIILSGIIFFGIGIAKIISAFTE